MNILSKIINIIQKNIYIQGNQKVSVHLTITVQSSGAKRLFDRPVIYIYIYIYIYILIYDRLCGLVVRVSGYRYTGFGFDSRRYQIF